MENREKLGHCLRLQGKKPLKQSLCEQSVQVTSQAMNKLQHLCSVFLWSRVKLFGESDWLTLDHYHPFPPSTHTHKHTLTQQTISSEKEIIPQRRNWDAIFLKGEIRVLPK